MTTRPNPAARRSGQVLDATSVAALFGRSASWFRMKREDLEAAGFPKKDPLLGGWLAAAVQAWLDQRAGAVVPSPAMSPEDLLLERAKTWSTTPGGRA